MPGPPHLQKRQIPHRLELPLLHAVNRVWRERRALERVLPGVLDCVCGREVAGPVADPVGVAGPDQDCDVGLNDGGEVGEEGAGVWCGWVSVCVRGG